MKRSTKQLLSLLLAIVMVFGLMAPAMAAKPMMGEVAETPVGEAAPAVSRGTSVKKATLMADATYTFSAATDLAALEANDKVSGAYGTSGFFKMGGTLTKKTETAMDMPRDKAAWVEFTITGTSASFTANIGGASNTAGRTSTVELYAYDRANGTYGAKVTSVPEAVEPEGTTTFMDGTWSDLTAGTYRLVCVASGTSARVVSCSVTEADGTTPSECAHTNKAEVAGSAKDKGCLEAGKEADQMCEDCYKVFPGDAIAAWGSHDFQDGVCSRCGDPDPSAVKAGGTYVLDIQAETETLPVGTGGTNKTAGDTTKAGTSNYFTIGWNGNSNSAITEFADDRDSNITPNPQWKWEDDYESKTRLKLDNAGRSGVVGQAYLGFKPLADAEVEIWWVGNAKTMFVTSGEVKNGLTAESEGVVAFYPGTDYAKAPHYSKFTVPYDETVTDGYKIGCDGGQVSIYKIKVTEKAPDTAYTIDVQTETEKLPVGTGGTNKTAGDTTKAGTSNYFTIGWNGNSNSAITEFADDRDATITPNPMWKWEDNYESKTRLKLDNAGRSGVVGQAYLGFTPSRNAIVEIWWVGNAKTMFVTSGEVKNGLTAESEGVVAFYPGTDYAKAPHYSKFTIPYDETVTDGYKFGCDGGQVSLYKVVVTETDTLDVPLDELVKEISDADLTLTSDKAGTQAAAVAALQTKLDNLVNNKDVTVTITPTASSFQAATDGTFTAPAGTDGQIKFTVKLTKGDEEATTEELTAAITAKAFVAVTGITVKGANNATSMEKGKALVLTATVTPADATVKDVEWIVATADQQYVTVNAEGRAMGKEVTPDGTTVTITAKAKDGSDVTGTIAVTVTAATVDPNAKYINDGKSHTVSAGDLSFEGTTDWVALSDTNREKIAATGFELYETKPGTAPSDTGGAVGTDPRNSVLRIPKDMGAGILFKVGPEGGRVNLTVKAASTGGSNNSPVFLIKDPEGEATPVREDSGAKTVKGTTATALTWTCLDEGTYLICSAQNATLTAPDGGNCTRGFRLMSAKVTASSPDDKVPTPVLQTYEDCAGSAKVNFNLPAAVNGVITVNEPTIKVDIEDLLMGTLDKDDPEDSPNDEFYQFAESVKVALYGADGKETKVTAVSSADNVKQDENGKFVAAKQTLTLTPTDSGTYTIKAIVTYDGATKELAVSDSFKFNLALGTPRTTSTESEAGRLVTLKWNAVSEATKYEIRYAVRGEDGDPAFDSAGMVVESTPATPAGGSNFTKDSDGNYVWSITMGDAYEGKVVTFYVVAIREGAVGADAQTVSVANNLKVQSGDQRQWDTKVFGTSASNAFNWKEGDLNADGQVKLYSTNGSGKITEQSSDGLLFYYTAIPKGTNYTIKAKVHVDRWQQQDTQNGVGIAAMDRVAEKDNVGTVGGNSGNFWNNSYMVGAARLGFRWDSENRVAYAADDPGADSYTSYSYYMGLLSIAKSGVPKGYDNSANPAHFYERRFPLDTRLPGDNRTCKFNGYTNRFNTIGNWTAPPKGLYPGAPNVESSFMTDYELTDFYVQMEKTNYGYVTTIWDENMNLLGTNTEWYAKGAAELSDGDDDGNPYTHIMDAVDAEGEPTASTDQSGNASFGAELGHMNADYEFIGFFTSRDMDAVFSEVEINTVAQAEDTRMKMPPVTPLKPKVSISSGTSANNADFTLSISSNVDGWVTIEQGTTAGTTVIKTNEPITADERLDLDVTLAVGTNAFKVKLTVDTDMEMPPFTMLDMANVDETKDLTANSTVEYKTQFAKLTNIFVSPSADNSGRGTRDNPVDVHTAVTVVQPGQNIILLGGVYELSKTISINRGMDGTAEKPIYFVADPNRTKPVVLNAMGNNGSVLIHGGNYWVFKDFEVVGSSDGSTGFQVSGSYNIVQGVKCHDNGSTGLQISRLKSSSLVPDRGVDAEGNPYGPATPPEEGVTPVNWGEWPCFNQIINCDSYRNYDSGYGGADGFGAKLTVGEGNVFDGCAAYWNADDGWDLYAKTSDEEGCIGVVVLRNCVAFENGYEVRALIGDPANQVPYMENDGYNAKMDYNADGTVNLKAAGNGNGFKMGGSHLPGAHEIYNSYAFYNAAKGFDSNNGPDITVSGCTAYNNGEENVGLSSSYTPKAYVVNKVVSFKDEKAPLAKDGETVAMADKIDDAGGNKIDEETYYAWNGTKSSNGSATIKSTAFKSLDFDATAWVSGANRSADGSLDLGDFLKLKSITDAGAGELVNDTTPVEDPDAVVNPPEEVSNDTATSNGNGGTLGGGADKKDDDNKTDDTPVYTADKKTSVNGDTTITVKDQNGDVVAEVKLPATIPAPETKFDDVADDHWAADAINNMAALGVVNGVGNNLYDKDAAVTRATIATMLWRFSNGKAGIGNTFADVADGQWYTDAIGWAAKVGVVTGYSESAFGPNDTITREQLATMLARYAKLMGMDTRSSAGVLADYQDKDSVSAWAVDGMAWCVQVGIINGVSADTLSPTTSATRAQTALMLNRFIALMK